jgi:hypothetical protein
MVMRLVEFTVSTDILTQVVRMTEGATVTRLVSDGTDLKVQAFQDPDADPSAGFRVWLRTAAESSDREREEWFIGSATLGGVQYFGYAQPLTESGAEEEYAPGYVHGSWSSGTTQGYEVGDLVNHNDVLYVCREAQAPARVGFTPKEPGAAGSSSAWEVALSGGSGGGELQAELVVTDPLADQSVGETYGVGTTIESVLRDMLISYQLPALSNLNPMASSVLEHGTAYTWTTPVAFNTTNTENITAGSGVISFKKASTVLNTDTFTYSTGTGTVAQSVAFPVPAGDFEVVSTNAGQSGTALNAQYTILVQGTNTNGGGFSRQDTLNVYYRTYFGATSTQFTGTNGSSVVAGLGGGTENDSKRTVTCTAANAGASNYTYFVMPTCHFDGVSSIVLNGAIPVYGAFTDKGTDTINGVEYTFFESNAPGAFSNGDSLVVS